MSTATDNLDRVPIVNDYFGDENADPIVAQEFTPGRGWVDSTDQTPISRKRANQLRRAGVTSVAVKHDGRLADFRIEELNSVRIPTKNLIR